MGFRAGIVGLPNVGKSTLFNALARAHAPTSNYPFCTIEPHVGIVTVPDPRLDRIAAIYKPAKVTPTHLEFIDIAGLVEGASQGEGLGNQFLSQIREVDLMVHVVRCFEAADIVHVTPEIDPVHDITIIETELALKDLETVTKRFEKTMKLAKSGEPKAKKEMEALEKLESTLSEGKSIRLLSWNEEENALIRETALLTAKPVVYCANVSEKNLPQGGTLAKKVEEIAAKEKAPLVIVSGKLEAEMIDLPAEEQEEFLKESGIARSALVSLIHEGYALLKLVTFFTANANELRAWTIPEGTRAPQAAGSVHSDFEKGFIRAEVIHYRDLDELGSAHTVKEKGRLGLEGKEYVVQDGDLILFRI